MSTGHVLLDVAEEYGEKRGIKLGEVRQQEGTAKRMLAKGCKLSEIIEFTGIGIDRLGELQESMRNEAV